jgi:hypothetical protein
MTQIGELEEINEEQLTHGQIEKRAYEIYLRHSGEEGHALEDWLMAEEEVRQERSSERRPSLRTRPVSVGQQR